MWIISDYDSSDKMMRFHQLKQMAKTDSCYAEWFMFNNYDIFTHTSTNTGLQTTQILNALTSMLNSYRRLPAIIVVVMGDKLMHDKVLLEQDLGDVLHNLCKRLIRQVESWLEKIPAKAIPDRKPQIYITKPLPKPEGFFGDSKEKFRNFASARKIYNSKLVAAVKQFGIGFINVGITQEDTAYFKKGLETGKFLLTDKGLLAYWDGVSSALLKLAELARSKHQPNTHLREPQIINNLTAPYLARQHEFTRKNRWIKFKKNNRQ